MFDVPQGHSTPDQPATEGCCDKQVSLYLGDTARLKPGQRASCLVEAILKIQLRA
jgi:hypothetical protein